MVYSLTVAIDYFFVGLYYLQYTLAERHGILGHRQL